MDTEVFESGQFYNYPLILKKLLKTPLIYAPEKEIVTSDQERLTYTDLNQRIHHLATGLRSVGVRQGDVVAVLDYDTARYLTCFFAIPMMGAVLQTVNWRLSPDQIVYTLQHAEAKFMIVHSDFMPLIESLRDRLSQITAILTVKQAGIKSDTLHSGQVDFEEMIQTASGNYDFPDLHENTKATTFYTTGTTGDPKGVYYSHRQLVLHTLAVCIVSSAYQTICRFRSDDVYMPLTPMFHVHAWGFPFVATLMGAKQVYPGPYEPERILRLIETEGVTFSHCVPTIMQMILSCPLARSIDLSRWKVVMGGAQLPKGLAKEAMELGINIHAGYGMSETGPVMTIATPNESMLDWQGDQLLNVITKTGKPLPLAEVEVVDDQVKKLPHDGQTTGEVVMRSPWLTQSYFKAPDKTKQLWKKGWLHSGDVGHIDTHGYLQITDRIKDVIKTGGEWVSSLDLENIMSQHPAVLESAAIGVPDEKWGERPMMIVTLKPEFVGQLNTSDFKAYMLEAAKQGKLPKYGVPDRYEFVEKIDKTSVGKLDKKVLRKKYSDKL